MTMSLQFQFQEALRLRELPSYVFAKQDELKRIERNKGVDLIDLGMGNPDLPIPDTVKTAYIQAIHKSSNWRYPEFSGLPEFRDAVSQWCQKQYGVVVNPDHEVIPLIGSKEDVVHLIFSLIGEGDIVLTPMPAYPAHFRGTILAGGTPVALPTDSTGQPLFDKISSDILSKTKLLILSYPTNPTALTATKESFEKAVAFCKKNNIILLHDFAYAEIYFEGKKPLSMLSIAGAKDLCIEFHTCSKTFSMAGFRIGFAVGNSLLISSLAKIKNNLDYGLCMIHQHAAIAALQMPKQFLDETRSLYQHRRDVFVEGMVSMGCPIQKPMATMYVWVPVPKGYNDTQFSLMLLEKIGIVVSPGSAFGNEGHGFCRFALVESAPRITQALDRMKKEGIDW